MTRQQPEPDDPVFSEIPTFNEFVESRKWETRYKIALAAGFLSTTVVVVLALGLFSARDARQHAELTKSSAVAAVAQALGADIRKLKSKIAGLEKALSRNSAVMAADRAELHECLEGE